MPYINQSRRTDLVIHNHRVMNAGELNYLVTRLVVDYLGADPRYSKYNEVVGVLECAKLELYRRMVAVYEDTKKEENGDVYV
jgi:hypothetical protein